MTAAPAPDEELEALRVDLRHLRYVVSVSPEAELRRREMVARCERLLAWHEREEAA